MKKISNVLMILILLFCCQNIQAYEEYKTGKKVVYNDEEYYVIQNSGKDKKYVTLVKYKPLTKQEIMEYGSEVQTDSYVARVTYVSPETDAPGDDYSYQFLYEDSFVKPVVDYWMDNYVDEDDLVSVDGYKARLLNNSDIESLEYKLTIKEISSGYVL